MCAARLVAVAAVLAGMVSASQASLITFATPQGSSLSGLPIDASVTFMVTAGSMTITIENLIVDPVSVIQNVSSVRFGLDVDLTGAALASNICTPRAIAGDGSYADGAPTSPAWDMSVVGQTILLSALGSGQPKYTVVGAPQGNGAYSSAKASIAGNGPHNPYAATTATFFVTLSALAENSVLNKVALGFGTSADTFVPAPEPATLALIMAGGIVVFLPRRRGR